MLLPTVDAVRGGASPNGPAPALPVATGARTSGVAPNVAPPAPLQGCPSGRQASGCCMPGVCELGHVEEEARPLDEARNRLRGRTSPVESPPSERTPAGRHVRRCAGWQADAGGGGGAGTCWCFFLINT
jgi:hypothetical protein